MVINELLNNIETANSQLNEFGGITGPGLYKKLQRLRLIGFPYIEHVISRIFNLR